TNDDKKATEEIVKEILNVFKETIPKHEWLDEETRKAAVEKAVSMKINMAYPDWIKDDKELIKEYPLEQLKNTALENLHAAIRSRVKKQFERLETTTDWSRQVMGPAVVNAAYSPQQNSISE